jgi:EAL domain-containing protein (putative c-di-GMP-specific phosphodiesterase class I)
MAKAEEFAAGILDVVRKPYVIDHHHLYISASIGVHQLNPLSLFGGNFISEVDIAMYEAKAQGRDGVIVFNKALEERVDRHLLIEQKLYQAIKEQKIEVHYQPQFDKHETLIGCESLIRWHDEELGALSPAEFVPIAEKTGLILELGSYVLRQTLETLNTWREKENRLKSYSINISMRQLLSDKFIEEVEGLMKAHLGQSTNHPKIYFEITEHVFAEDMKKVILMMNRLIALGISFSIDDFGTGYSSLSYLSLLPIEEVKIDKSFVSRLGESENDKKMISTIITIAKNFDLNIVAEGIETFEQLAVLLQYECDAFQGFYFEKALSQAKFEAKYFSVNA